MEAMSLLMAVIMSHAESGFSIHTLVFGVVGKADMSGNTAI